MEHKWLLEKGKLVHKNKNVQRILGRKYCHAKNTSIRLEGVLEAAETNKAFEKKKTMKSPRGL